MYGEFLKTIKEMRKYLKYLIWAGVIIYFLSGIYTISQDQVGILLRFGKIINPKVNPGFNYHFPYPFERIIKAPIKRINTMVIDDFSDSYEAESTPRKFYDITGLASYCVTGDNNIVGISMSIQYKIGNPANYYFMQNSPERIIYEIAANSIIKILSHYDVDSILTSAKRDLGISIRNLMQERLNSIDSGVDVYFIDISYIRPPESVQSFFDDVINAKIERKNMLDEALSYKNTELLRASGEKASITESAKGYKTSVININEGEADRFTKRIEGFRGYREIIISDVYLEYALRIFNKVRNLYLIDPKDESGSSRLRFIIDSDNN